MFPCIYTFALKLAHKVNLFCVCVVFVLVVHSSLAHCQVTSGLIHAIHAENLVAIFASLWPPIGCRRTNILPPIPAITVGWCPVGPHG